jgi:chloride channel protein, CIC family
MRVMVLQRNTPTTVIAMLMLGFLVGIIGGYGAILFRWMIGWVHNLLFLGQFSHFYDANAHTAPSIWGMGVIFVPVVGAIFVTWIVKTFAPEAKGHGVPEVIDAVYYNEGKIRPSIAIFKSIASAISIGTGGSVGREGPIIQIGAAFGSTVGQIIPMPMRQRIVLVAAGAGAGIAATFNAPIGGVVFAIELLLVSVNALTLAVVAIATVTATYISRYYLGLHPAFDIPAFTIASHTLTPFVQLYLFVPFGILIGLLSTLFVKMIYWFEDLFNLLPVNDYFRHMLGMFIVGIIIYLLMRYAGHYYVQGVGYATIVDVLKIMLTDPWFLLLLCALKLLATSLTLGSGASGGIFSPGLFMGATLGAAVGQTLSGMLPQLAIDPVMFAVAGMAGMLSGTTGAVLTAITMLFEMTRDYNAILPVVLTVTIAYVTRISLSKASIYTLKLLRRGHIVQEGLQAAVISAQQARHVMSQEFITIDQHRLKLDSRYHEQPTQNNPSVIVTRGDHILGVLIETLTDATAQFNVDAHFLSASPETLLLDILRDMDDQAASYALVFSANQPHTRSHLIGIITPTEVMRFAKRTAQFLGS